MRIKNNLTYTEEKEITDSLRSFWQERKLPNEYQHLSSLLSLELEDFKALEALRDMVLLAERLRIDLGWGKGILTDKEKKCLMPDGTEWVLNYIPPK